MVLKWKKCHFIVNGEIVLQHRVSKKRLEIDKSKWMPFDVKGERRFLGHVDLQSRFVKYFSKLTKLLCKLLKHETIFNFSEDCVNVLWTRKFSNKTRF